MKKILILSITLILLAAIAVTGTLAFYTDEESEVNVMNLYYSFPTVPNFY